MKIVHEIDATIGIPLYNSSPIFWLCLESLCRQLTGYTWEVVICEDPSEKFCGEEYIAPYASRLTKAGCVNIKYLSLDKWVPLGDKWIHIAKNSMGENFILTAADDYCSPDRITRSCDALSQKNIRWIDSKNILYYNLLTGKTMYLNIPDPWSGVFMSTKTKPLSEIRPIGKKSGVDNWLRKQLKINEHNRLSIEPSFLGLNTDGFNNISSDRRNAYKSLSPSAAGEYIPIRPEYTISDVLPDDIHKKLLQFIIKI